MTYSPDLDRRAALKKAGGLAASLAAAGTVAGNFARPEEKRDAENPAADNAALDGDQPDLSGKSILITGTSSGFGRLGAEYYARLGAKVFATMRNLPRPEGDALRALAAKEGLDITVSALDVTSDEEVTEAIEAANAAAGTLDVVINNAGISYAGPVEMQDIEAAQHIFETNVFGPQRVARAALPAMRAAGEGYIINVSSQLGRLVIPGFGLYSPSKYALEAMSEQMAYELVPHGIDVTIIQPGGYPTKIWENQVPLSAALKVRSSEDQITAYPEMTARMGVDDGGGGGDSDPMDVPRAIAAAIGLPAGKRPLRKAVHPGSRPQEPINEISAQQQYAFLGKSPYGPLIQAVQE